MELEIIERIKKKVTSDPRVICGIGDDAAILETRCANTVVTVDLLTEGIDFILEQTSVPLIGRKALAVNLSDLAAMGAIPHSVVVAVALPRHRGQVLAEQLMEGLLALAGEYNVALAGGDTNSWREGLVISITAIGQVTPRGALLRSGARPGDRIIVTGGFGGSFLERQFLFQPRVSEALFLNSHYDIHAAIDVSDSLLLDLSRLAGESHCGFVLNESSVPIHDDVWRCWKILETIGTMIQSDSKLRSILSQKNEMDKSELSRIQKEVRFPMEIDLHNLRRTLGQALWLDSNVTESILKDNNWISNNGTSQRALFGEEWKQQWILNRALQDGEDFELILAVPPDEAERLINEQPLMNWGVPLTDIGSFLELDKGFCTKNKRGDILPIRQIGGYLHQFD